jgi:transposase
MSINSAPMMAATVVAVDVGKNTAALSVTDAARRRLLGPINFAMTAVAVSAVLDRVCGVLPGAVVKVGVELPGIITGRCWRWGCGRRAGRCWS